MRSRRLSLYDILGVARCATAADIKTAFRALAHRHHPDKNNNSPSSTALFQAIQNAYAVLSDPASRTTYDASLPSATDPRAGRSPSGTVRGTRPAIRGANPNETASLVLSHLNAILWDIEDLLRSHGGPAFPIEDRALQRIILMMLTFIDGWVLDAAGFPDYFFQARGLRPTQKVAGSPALPYASLAASHRPYTDLEDYFYDIRKRADRLLTKARLVDLLAEVPGKPVRIIDGILEAHNFCYHYLGWLRRTKNDEIESIPAFHHSNAAFEQGHV